MINDNETTIKPSAGFESILVKIDNLNGIITDPTIKSERVE